MKIRDNRVMKVIMLMSLFVIGFCIASPVQAEEDAVGYYYEIAHPDNQVGTGNALNLKMTPGQSVNVPITLVSRSTKDIEVELSLNGARTNGSGGLEYGPSTFEKDRSMKIDLPEVAKVPESVKVPAKGKTTFDLTITMPKESFQGIVTGGLRFMQKNQEKSESNKDAQVVNKLALLVGVTLFNDETKVAPKLDLLKVEAGLSNYRNSFILSIANQTPTLVKGLTLEANITEQGKEEKLYDSFKNLMQMAPNAVMNYPISLGGDNMKAGNYTAHVVMKDEGDNEWKWTKDFVVTKEKAKKLNDESVGITEEPRDWKLIAMAGVVILLVIVVIVLFIKNKKKK